MPDAALRYENATIQMQKSGSDFLRPRVVIARTGVFPYVHPGKGVVYEAKLPEELLSESTVNSAKGVPILDGHPPVEDNNGIVHGKNYSKYAKGAFGDSVIVDADELLAGHETIWDEGLRDDLLAGKKLQVSIGSRAQLDWTPGEYKGQKYDLVQRNIRINHIAHVEKGRAGEQVRAYLDHADKETNIAVMLQEEERLDAEEKTTMPDKSEAYLADLGRRFLGLFVRNDADPQPAQPAQPAAPAGPAPISQPASPAPGESSAEQDAENKQRQNLQAQIDALKALLQEKTQMLEQANSPATMDSLVEKRIQLKEMAKAVDSEVKLDGLSEREIKLKVIQKALPFPEGTRFDSMNDVVIDARYEAACEVAREKAALRTNVPGGSPETKLDANEIAEMKKARQKVHEMK